MRRPARPRIALVGVALLLAGGCSDSDSGSTSVGAGAPTSTAPAVTTTLAATTTAPASTVPPAPTVAEAGGWRLAMSAPTTNAIIGPATDVCYELTGTAGAATVAFEVSLVLAATGTVVSRSRVDAAVGRGAARVNVGTPEQRRYNFTVQGIVNGQPVDRLAVTVGIILGETPPTGCP